MEHTNANSAAFPCEQGTDPNGSWNQTFEPGLSKREYFAAIALQGILSNSAEFDDRYKTYAALAVEYADELLKRLE